MSFSNLEKEIKNYTDFNYQSLSSLSKLCQFFKTFGQEGKKFAKNTAKSLEEYMTELKKENNLNTMNKVNKDCNITTVNLTYSYFEKSFQNYLKFLETTFEKFEKIYGDEFSETIARYQKNTDDSLNKFNDLLNLLNDGKKRLEKYKYNYFSDCKSVIEQENKLIRLNDNKIIKQEEISKINSDLGKYINLSTCSEQSYKDEITKMNKLLENNEDTYTKIVKSFRECHNKKISELTRILKNFISDVLIFTKSQPSYIEKLDKIGNNIQISRDMILYDEKFNYYNDYQKRFLLEKFLDYRKFSKNLNRRTYSMENPTTNNSAGDTTLNYLFGFITGNSGTINTEKTENNVINEANNRKEKINMQVLMLGRNDSSFINKDLKAKNYQTFIKKILFNSEKINDNEYNDLLNELKKDTNPKNYIDSIDKFMSVLITFYKQNKIIKISNNDNLNSLSQILNNILNIASKSDQIFEICFMIIFVAETTMYFNPNNTYNKFYLCKLLSKNEIFKSTEFWTKLIDKKIALITEKSVKTEISKREQMQDYEKNEGGMLSYVKNVFMSNKMKENQELENEILYGQIYEEKLPMSTVLTLNEFIYHFSNFNFVENASGLIIEMSTKYKFDYSFVTYCIAELNSNIFSIKNKGNGDVGDTVKKLDYEQLYFNTENKKFKKILDKKLRGIIYSLKYVSVNEIPNLFAINKNYNKALKKIIYKNILIKYRDMDIKKHLNIWKIIMNYNENKQKYNYNEIKEKITKIEKDNPKNKSMEVIDLDVNRTFFENDKEANRIKISYILKSISTECPNINYSQGMNFIAAFLLNICENEEEAFYLFISLLNTSDYGKLFTNELANLKKFFYVFERLLNILLPELFNYLKVNNVKMSYFTSSWFITLFTDTYSSLKEKGNIKLLLRVWDMFLFSGCKSILKVGISMLKNYESKIMSLPFEELLRFLISDIKTDFFQKSTYDELMKISINFKIDSSLISDIESEFEMKKSLPENYQKLFE